MYTIIFIFYIISYIVKLPFKWLFFWKNPGALLLWKIIFLGCVVILTSSGNTVVLKNDASKKTESIIFFWVYTHFKYSKHRFSILFSLKYYSLFNNLEILEFIPAGIISLVDIILNLSPKVCYFRSWSFIKTNGRITGRLKFIISCLHESWTKIQN